MNSKGSSILSILVIGFLFGIGGVVGFNAVNSLNKPIKINHICKMSHKEIQKQTFNFSYVPESLYDKNCDECIKILKQIENSNKEEKNKIVKRILMFIISLTLLSIICRIIYFYTEEK